MRILLTPSTKKELFILLKEKYNCSSIKQLSLKMNISVKTLQGWFYLKNRCIPDNILDKNIKGKLKIVEERNEKWGQIKGGLMTYDKLGAEEFRKMQALGGKKAAKTKENEEIKKFRLDVNDPSFLEFYGILLGDGWLSNFISGNRRVWLIGISTNLKLEKEFIKYYSSNIRKLFNRKGTIKERIENNVSEFIFSHKILLKYLHEKLDFPIGKKENLKINDSIYSLGFDKLKYVIRGIFDTDGSFYLDRNKKGIPSYPIISIHMKEPILINQLFTILSNRGFRVNYDRKNNMIKIKGREQLNKWLDEIGSSNPYKFKKMQDSFSPKR